MQFKFHNLVEEPKHILMDMIMKVAMLKNHMVKITKVVNITKIVTIMGKITKIVTIKVDMQTTTMNMITKCPISQTINSIKRPGIWYL